MTKRLRIEVPIHIKRDRRARKILLRGSPPAIEDSVPRAARLLALAHKWEGMARRGEVKDYAEIARRHGLSRARVTQVCGLTLIPPRVQERILLAPNDLPSVPSLLASQPVWSDQNPSR